MGCDYTAQLIAGCEIDHVPVLKKVIKYNEDTGKPYEAKKSDFEHQIDGVPINLKKIEENMEVFYEPGGTIEFIGVSISTEGYEQIDDINELINEAKARFIQCELDENLVGLFVRLDVSV